MGDENSDFVSQPNELCHICFKYGLSINVASGAPAQALKHLTSFWSLAEHKNAREAGIFFNPNDIQSCLWMNA